MLRLEPWRPARAPAAALAAALFAAAPPPVAAQTTVAEPGDAGFPAELFDPADGPAAAPRDPDAVSAPRNAAPQSAAPPSAAASPDPAQTRDRKLRKAEQVLRLALPRDRLAAMLGAFRPELEKQLRDEAGRRGKTLTPEMTDRLVADMEAELGALYAAVFPKLPPLYADAFTEAELDKLLDLYGSPEGRSVLAKLGGLSVKVAAVMRDDIADYRARLRDRVVSALRELD